MNYSGLADLLDKHRTEIAERTVRQIFAENLSYYVNMTQKGAVQNFASGIGSIAQYLRDNDLTKLRQHIEKSATRQLTHKANAMETNRANLILAEKIKEIVNEKLIGPENERDRASYLRRLEVLMTMDRTMGMTNVIKG